MLKGGDATAWLAGTIVVLVLLVILSRRGAAQHFRDLALDAGARTAAFAVFDDTRGAATFTEMRQRMPELDAVAFTDLRREWKRNN